MNKLLLVDDSRATLSALKSQIDEEHFVVKTALSVKDALVLLESTKFDCIMTDYEMPEVDGPSFCRILKGDERFQHIPVIVLTSMSKAEYLLTAISAGADDFISKDADVRIMLAKIHAMLRIKRFHDELIHLRRAEGIKQIVATYNHEFNNPLTIAIGNLNWLRKHTEAEEHQTRLSRLGDALGRMAELVKKIRELRDFVEASYASGETLVSLHEKPNKAG